MNQGGEPAHDDYGLPWVDIEIPDDARELDRDVQAYHRELRALRRVDRSNRWRAPLRKSGMVVPLMAGCLVLAMIGGMVLTMFSANPSLIRIGRESTPPAARASSATGRPSASPGGSASAPGRSQSPASRPVASAAARLLPAGTIRAAGKDIPLRALITAAIAIIPGNCNCTHAIGRLLDRASVAGVRVYLVGLRGSTVKDLRSLAPTSAGTNTVLAIDVNNALEGAYQPIARLTVLLVDRHRHVRPALAVSSNAQLDRELRALK